MSTPSSFTSRTPPPSASRDGITIAIFNENRAPHIAGTVLSALRTIAHLHARAIAADVFVIDNASRDGSLPLARQIEALHFADGVRLVAFAQRQHAAILREYVAHHATYRYVIPLLTGVAPDADTVFALYETIVAQRAAAVSGHRAFREPLYDGSVQNAGGLDQETGLPAGDGSPLIALLDRFQVLEAGGYQDMPGDESSVDRECYAYLRASGRRVVFVAPVSIPITDPR